MKQTKCAIKGKAKLQNKYRIIKNLKCIKQAKEVKDRSHRTLSLYEDMQTKNALAWVSKVSFTETCLDNTIFQLRKSKYIVLQKFSCILRVHKKIGTSQQTVALMGIWT